MKNYLKYLTLALLAAFSTVTVDAKGSSGGGRSSGGGSRSGGFSSRPSSTPKAPSNSKNGFSSQPGAAKSSTSSPPKRTAFDVAEQRKALTPPKPKEEFVQDFKVKNAGKYPTTFSTPPATRPTYIPQTTVYGGQSRQIEYNQQAGGYGFLDGLGRFMIYDAITDMAFGEHEKEKTVYVEKSKELDQAHAAAVSVENEDNMGWTIFWIVLGGGILIFVVYIIFANL